MQINNLRRALPNRALIARVKCAWTRINGAKKMVTTERQDRLVREREEIEARIAKFRATQEKFQRERDEFFRRTWRNIEQVELQPTWP
jgi:hypothetical protein